MVFGAPVQPESISLRVESKHRVERWNGSTNAKVLDLRDGVSISCSVQNSRPKAEIEWMWNGLKIASNISDETQVRNLFDSYNSEISWISQAV